MKPQKDRKKHPSLFLAVFSRNLLPGLQYKLYRALHENSCDIGELD